MKVLDGIIEAYLVTFKKIILKKTSEIKRDIFRTASSFKRVQITFWYSWEYTSGPKYIKFYSTWVLLI